MEASTGAQGVPREVVDKGLKKDALGFVSSVVIAGRADPRVPSDAVHRREIWYAGGHREFFMRKPEVADVGSLEAPPPAAPTPTAGVA